MKIAIITSPFCELPPNAVGAVEKLFYLLANEWVKAAHEVCFICAGGGDNPKILYRRLAKYRRTGSTKTDLIWDFFYSLKAVWKCPKSDVLMCNTFWSPVLAPLFRWKYKKLIYGVHRFPKGQFFLYPFVRKFVCVSTAVAEELRKQVSESRVSVIPNPIDTAVFFPAERQTVKGRVLYAGRIHPLKGLRTLAQACSELFQEGLVSELVLVGPWEGEMGGGGAVFVDELRKIAGALPIVLRGAIQDARALAEFERTAEVFVYPSEDVRGEAFGVAPLESMALGVPTVVSNLKCFDEFVENRTTAIRFEIGNVNDLCSQLRMLLGDKVFQGKLGARGSDVAARFSVSRIGTLYLEEFERG